MSLKQQGTIRVDLDGRGGLVVLFPDGTSTSANNADHARATAERWLQTNMNQERFGTQGMAKIEWHNGANYWKGAPGSEQKRLPGDARLTVRRAPGQELPLVVSDVTSRPVSPKYIRVVHRFALDARPCPSLVVAEPVSAITVDDDWLVVLRAKDSRVFKWPMQSMHNGSAVEVCRVDVSDQPLEVTT